MSGLLNSSLRPQAYFGLLVALGLCYPLGPQLTPPAESILASPLLAGESPPPSAPTASWRGGPPPAPDTLGTVSTLLFQRTNQVREEHDLSPLERDSTLEQVACAHSRDMLTRGFLSHTNPSGEGPSDRVAKMHRRLVGSVVENVWGRTILQHDPPHVLADEIITDLMNSPPHRKVILMPKLTHLGVCGGKLGLSKRFTQLFANVRAYLQSPLPYRVRANSRLSISFRSTSDRTPTATKYDYWNPETGLKAVGPWRLEENIYAPGSPGTYRLRLYFPVGDHYRAYHGPEIVIH